MSHQLVETGNITARSVVLRNAAGAKLITSRLAGHCNADFDGAAPAHPPPRNWQADLKLNCGSVRKIGSTCTRK